MKKAAGFESKNIVITGLGAVTPFGIGVKRFWDSVKAGKNAFGPINTFRTEGHRTYTAAEAPEMPSCVLYRLDQSVISRADSLALTAVSEALENAGLLNKDSRAVNAPERIGLIVGTAAGGILGLEEYFRKKFLGSPVEFPQGILSSFCLSSIATNIAREFIIKGPRMTVATVCSSSGLALAAAKEILEYGDLDRVLVVGTETLSEVTHAGFNCLRSVAPKKCQPFDLNRKGLILGEGAGAVVVEKEASAAARNVLPIAYLRGYGLSTDLHHFTAPQPEGNAIAETVGIALADAGMEKQYIDYVCMHGTGTPLNDVAETRGIKKVFGAGAYKIAVSSIKSMIGHQLGAASIMQTIATVLCIRQGLVPPTTNLETRDPDCDLDYVTENGRVMEVKSALSNAFAFGGSNISLVFSREGNQASNEILDIEYSLFSPVITGIGLTTPLGVGCGTFAKSIESGRSGIVTLKSIGNEWKDYFGGLVDMILVRDATPVSIRRRLNRQASFLFVSMKEALKDAGIDHLDDSIEAMIYGSAFGCSGNVHRFYTQVLQDGARFASPHEFNMSVTNAPPSLVAKEFGLSGPIWVFVADDVSWEVSLHWGARMIQGGKAKRVIVSSAEELSSSILAIHRDLGLIDPGDKEVHHLGEGSISVILESLGQARARGAKIYGRILGFGTASDPCCGPLDYSYEDEIIGKAVSDCMYGVDDKGKTLVCVWNNPTLESEKEKNPCFRNIWQGDYKEVSFLSRLGQSGLSGGLGMAGALFERDSTTEYNILVITGARGGIQAATLIQRPVYDW